MSTQTATPPARTEPVELAAHIEAAAVSELRIVVGRLVRRLRSRATFPLTQASVLGRLERDGAQCIGELANAEQVRPQSMSQTLAELEADGLISRSPDETDGRRTKIDLTAAGHAALSEDRAQRDGWLAEAVARFTPEEQQILARAVPLLERLASD